MNLSQIRVALDDAGVRPAKKLGQNFLHDQNLARWIVEQAQISRDDFVLEIGPGLGALTSEILKRGCWRWRKMRGWRIFCAKNFATRDSNCTTAMRSISTGGFYSPNATSN